MYKYVCDEPFASVFAAQAFAQPLGLGNAHIDFSIAHLPDAR